MKSALRVMSVLLAFSAIPALVACSARSEVPSGRCDPLAARALIEQLKPTDEEAKHRTGATIVRQITPGQPVTHDFRDYRVTLEINPTSGRVVAATCG
ncbi:I78 family peptidase inhibitor (plasmid) [Rhizobium sp. 32-5/1]|uniref:I78 family peptidase inhibitor n=1 Tax=Rhizobium sp. 32-5/1 TaxID=3019602 RepID=UPI00240D02A1|nr:I78 family peptidase inhibitor [Rhizobium sp. 32-5/1]WEZ85999.1 I78 family peptidase inhibitor [Rhizobium sp. 32-5/1]